LHRLPCRSLRARTSSTLLRLGAAVALFFLLACAPERPPVQGAGDANAGVDSLNARISKAYRDHDPAAYGRLFTDSAVFEWPAFTTVRGRAGLEAMARTNWAALRDMDLELDVAHRRVASDHVTEFGAFRQAYADSAGARSVEHGRYVAVLVRGSDGWLMDRFFGFSDSTVKVGTGPGRTP
jgi:ketosteroid isomerase-like protein